MPVSCGHTRHVGPCPSCQRAKAALLHTQEETVKQLVKRKVG